MELELARLIEWKVKPGRKLKINLRTKEVAETWEKNMELKAQVEALKMDAWKLVSHTDYLLNPNF